MTFEKYFRDGTDARTGIPFPVPKEEAQVAG